MWRPPEPARFVLLDAPCTATGAIRRHPDVPHLKSPDDVARLSAVQERLLGAAIDMLAPGGTLVYCTCSLEPEEGPELVAAILRPGILVVTIRNGASFTVADRLDTSRCNSALGEITLGACRSPLTEGEAIGMPRPVAPGPVTPPPGVAPAVPGPVSPPPGVAPAVPAPPGTPTSDRPAAPTLP